MARLLKRLSGCESGATAVEYGLILSLIVLAMIGALSTLADSTITMWNGVSDKVVNAEKVTEPN